MENHEAVAPLAKRFGCPLVVRATELDDLVKLHGLHRPRGPRFRTLDPAPATLGEFLVKSTAIRKRAIERTAPDLGHPVYLDATAYVPEEAAIVTGILENPPGVIVTSVLPPAPQGWPSP